MAFGAVFGHYEFNNQIDALRIRVDMRPFGVCFDATGTACGPSTGMVGGTTPSCAVSQFGNALAPAALERVYLDVDRKPAPGPIHILVDRPITGVPGTAALWFGFPTLTPSPLFPELELWGDPNTAVFFNAIGVGDESWRLPLTLPNGPATFTVQFVTPFLPVNFCAPGGPCVGNPLCPTVFDAAASPALWLTY